MSHLSSKGDESVLQSPICPSNSPVRCKGDENVNMAHETASKTTRRVSHRASEKVIAM